MTPSRSTILFLNPAGILGGAERGLLQVLGALDSTRYEAKVLLGEPGPLVSELERLGVFVRVLPMPRAIAKLSRQSSSGAFLKAIVSFVGYFLKMLFQIRKMRPDCLWSNGIKCHYLAWGLTRFLRIPYVLHLRDIANPKGFPTVLASARLILGNSPSTLRLAQCPLKRAYVLPNSIPIRSMRRSSGSRKQARLRFGLSKGEFTILAVGALTPHKGQERLLRIFAEVCKKIPESRLLLVGHEPYQTDSHQGEAHRLKALSSELKIASKVVFTGSLEPPWAAYRAADLFALPSLSEGFGRVFLEAAAFSLPLLGTKVGGLSDIFTSSQAILLPPESQAEWVESIVRLGLDPTQREALGRRARQRAGDFDLSHLAPRLSALVPKIWKSSACS